MRYQHLKIYKKIQRFFFPVVPILIALFLVVTQIEVPVFVTSAAHVVAKPFWSSRDFVIHTIENITESFSSKNTLIKENTALKEELLSKTRETFTTRALSLENQNLLELLGRINKNPELLPVAVLHGKTFSPYDTFFIDQGSNDGVRDNMLVLTPENIAIGSITKTLEHTAIVTRFSAPGMSYDVLLGATTSVHTNLEGRGSGTMLISIPRDTQTVIGDIVTLPSFKSYILGTVVSIEVAPEDAYKILYVTSPINVYELRYVVVDTTSIWKVEPPSTTTDIDGDNENETL